MKSFSISTFVSFGFPLLSLAAVIPQDGPGKPNRQPSAPGATRATARFGPFKLPSSSVVGGMGMTGINTDNVANVAMPCKGCTYTYIRGDMVYKNGTSANLNNGAYMHHMTLVAMPDGMASPFARLPGEVARDSPKMGGGDLSALGIKSVYLIGNERLPLTFPNAGVYVEKKNAVTLNVLLQNMEEAEKEVYIDMDYDYLPGQPAGYTDIIPVSQDSLGMGAMMGNLKQTGAWEKTSGGYTVGQNSRVLMMYGHLHDGGIKTEILVNGKVACDSAAYYQDMKIPAGQSTTAAETGDHGHSKRDGGVSHIVAFGECLNVGGVQKGDVLTTKVYYNFDKRPSVPMPNGKLDSLMGISMTYLGIPMKKE